MDPQFAYTQPTPGSTWAVSTTGANSTMTLTYTQPTGRFPHLAGFAVTGGGATGASVINVVVSGTVNGLNFNLGVPAGATASITPLIVNFTPGIPGFNAGSTLTITVPAFGSGNTTSAITMWGYLL